NSFAPKAGDNTVSVRQVDAAGNASLASNELDFTLDNAVSTPIVQLVTDSGRSSTDGLTNTGTLDVQGIEGGALVEYSTDAGQTWLDTFTAKEGVNHVEVRQTDVAGNKSAVTLFSFTLDTTVTEPKLSVPQAQSGHEYNANEVGPDGTITVAIKLPIDAAVGDTLTITDGQGHKTVHALTDTDVQQHSVAHEVAPGHDIKVTLTDQAGNTSQEMSATLATADITSGTITIEDKVSGDDVLNHAEQGKDLVISGTTHDIEDGQVVTVHFNGQDYFTQGAGNVHGGAWSVTIPTSALGHLTDAQAVDITADVTDAAGNPAPQATHHLDVDIFAGDPSINFSDNGFDGIYNASELNPDGTATATIDLPKDAVVGDTLTLTTTQVSKTTVDGHYSLTAQDILAGHVDFEVKPGSTVTASITDHAGNISNVATATATLADATPPSVEIHVGLLASDNIINSSESSKDVSVVGYVTGEYKQGDEVTVTVDKDTYKGILDGSGHFSIEVPGSVLKDHNSFEARIDTSDLAGNKAHATTTHDYSVDTQVDKPSISLETSGSDHIYNIQEVGSDGTVTATIDIPLDAVAGETLTINNVPRVLTATDILTRQVMTEVKPGSTVTASITDNAGNVSELAKVQVAPENLETPKVTINVDGITDDNIINQSEAGSLVDINAGTSTQLITGTVQGDFNSGDIVVIDNLPSATGTVDSSGKFSISVPTKELLGQTSLHLHMDTQNAAGNPGHGTAVHDYSVDTQVGAPIINFEGQQGNPHIYNAKEVGTDGTIKATIMLSPDATIHDTLIVNGKPMSLTQDIVNSGEVVIEVHPGDRVEASIQDNAGNISSTTIDIAPDADVTPPDPLNISLQHFIVDSSIGLMTKDGDLQIDGIESSNVKLEFSVDGGNTWSEKYQSSEGENHVLARQTDAAGNVSAASNELVFTLDTKVAEPIVALKNDTGISSSDKWTNDGTLDVTGIETGATVEYSVDDTHWTSSFTATEGINTVYVRQTDAVGNVSKSTTFKFMLDTKVDEPTIHFQKTSVSNIYNQKDVDPDGKVTATIDLPDGALSGETLTFDSKDHVLSDADIKAKCITTQVTPGTALSATYTDIAGNVSNVVTETAPKADVIPPSVHIHIDSVATDNIINNSESQKGMTVPVTGVVTGEFDVNDHVTITIDNTPYTGFIVKNPDGSGHFTVDVPSNELMGHTSLEAQISTTDSAGNTGSATDTHAYTVAKDIPIVTLRDIALGNDPRPAISGHVDVKSPVLIPTGTEVEIKIVGDLHTYKVTTDANGDFVLAKGMLQQDLPDGPTDILATVTDTAGNVGKTSESVNIDTIAPTPQIHVDDITTDNYINSSESKGYVLVTGKVTGSFHDGAAVTLTVHGKEFHGTTDAQGIYKIKVSGADLKDDTNIEAKVVVTDKAGIEGSDTIAHPYFVDTTLHTPTISLDPASDTFGQDPASSSTTVGSNSDHITNDVNPTFSISGVDVDAKSVEIFDGKTSLGFAQRDGSSLSSWIFTARGLTKQGVHHITAQVTDNADNQASSQVCDVTIDTETHKPTLSVQNANNNNASPKLTGTAEAGSLVVIKDNNLEIGSTVADDKGHYEYDMSSQEHAHKLGEGTHQLVAEAIDKAGNTLDSAGTSTTIKPEYKLIYAPSGSTKNIEGTERLIHGTVTTHTSHTVQRQEMHLVIDGKDVRIDEHGHIDEQHTDIHVVDVSKLSAQDQKNPSGSSGDIVEMNGITGHVNSVNGNGFYLYLPGSPGDYELGGTITGSKTQGYNISQGIKGINGLTLDIGNMNGVKGIIFSDGESILASQHSSVDTKTLVSHSTTETFHMNTDSFLHTTTSLPAGYHRVVTMEFNGDHQQHLIHGQWVDIDDKHITEFHIFNGQGVELGSSSDINQGKNIQISEADLKGLYIVVPRQGKTGSTDDRVDASGRIDLHFEGHIVDQSGHQVGDSLTWHFIVERDSNDGKIDGFKYHSSSSSDEPTPDVPEVNLDDLAADTNHGADTYLAQLGLDTQHDGHAQDLPSDIDVVLGHGSAVTVDGNGIPVADQSAQVDADHSQHQDNTDPMEHHDHQVGHTDVGDAHHG
ncbi:Ig-like domain-containing protein, partial [Vibrio sp. UCD-FRSSP16_30]|uniref:Ig-like domain-containing protein n=2 Tax=unclassified Vibrio TaxID=2614977 RepID=UPI000B17F012